MTDEATNDDIAAAALDASAPDAGQDPALDPAAIDASTVAPQPLAFIAPDDGTQSSLGAPGSGQTVRVSTEATRGEANGSSFFPAVSRNPRYVAFDSFASNLVPDHTNGQPNVFVKDLRTGQVTLASADADGTEGNDSFGGSSFAASLSADGHAVAFTSSASNLVPDDTNGSSDVFAKDLSTGQVTLASADAGGNPGDRISIDPAIPPNGRYVSFTSDASNLVAGDTSSVENVFVKDLWSGGSSSSPTTRRPSSTGSAPARNGPSSPTRAPSPSPARRATSSPATPTASSTSSSRPESLRPALSAQPRTASSGPGNFMRRPRVDPPRGFGGAVPSIRPAPPWPAQTCLIAFGQVSTPAWPGDCAAAFPCLSIIGDHQTTRGCTSR